MSWHSQATTAYNCLESISHLLAGRHESHSTLVDISYRHPSSNTNGNYERPVLGEGIIAVVAHGVAMNGNHIDRHEEPAHNQPIASREDLPIEVLEAAGVLIRNQEANNPDWVDPSDGIGSSVSSTIHSVNTNSIGSPVHGSIPSVPVSPEQIAERLQTSFGYDGNESSDWFRDALRGISNIPQLAQPNNCDVHMGASPSNSSPSPPQLLPLFHAIFHESPNNVPQDPFRFFNPIRREDPVEFHLNAFDSPPPSPPQLEAELANVMHVDEEGLIPDLPVNYLEEPQEHSPSVSFAEIRRYGCSIDYCHSFGHFLETTQENIKDKKNILKELFTHTTSLLKKSAEVAPVDKLESLIDLSASVALIGNSLGTSTDLESFQKFSENAMELVFTIQLALVKQLRTEPHNLVAEVLSSE